jgi:hypothetical protein
MAQRIGDDVISDKDYQKLRQKYRQAKTTTPWQQWAQHYLSPAGKRNHELVQARDDYEARTKAAAWAGIAAQREAMDRELEPDTAEVRELHQRANARDLETHEYTPAAVAAQSQLAALGVAPRRRGG